MLQMIGLSWKSLGYVFFLCFGSFLAGWLTALFILPGKKGLEGGPPAKIQHKKNLSVYKSDHMPNHTAESSTVAEIPFFEELRDNIMLLFDPYKMDSLMRKNTFLEDQGGPIKDHSVQKQGRPPVILKKQRTEKGEWSGEQLKNPPQTFYRDERASLPSIPEPVPDEAPLAEGNEIALSPLKKLQQEYDKKNREQFARLSSGKKVFSVDGKFSFLVNVFSEQDEAMEFFSKMKSQYPSWSFFLKVHKDHIRVYLGPFSSKEKAMEFKKSQPHPLPFSQDFLEEVSL